MDTKLPSRDEIYRAVDEHDRAFDTRLANMLNDEEIWLPEIVNQEIANLRTDRNVFRAQRDELEARVAFLERDVELWRTTQRQDLTRLEAQLQKAERTRRLFQELRALIMEER